jgi:hypothetical protein
MYWTTDMYETEILAIGLMFLLMPIMKNARRVKKQELWPRV